MHNNTRHTRPTAIELTILKHHLVCFVGLGIQRPSVYIPGRNQPVVEYFIEVVDFNLNEFTGVQRTLQGPLKVLQFKKYKRRITSTEVTVCYLLTYISNRWALEVLSDKVAGKSWANSGQEGEVSIMANPMRGNHPCMYPPTWTVKLKGLLEHSHLNPT